MYGKERTMFGRETTWVKKNLNMEKIAYKVVQINFLSIHISLIKNVVLINLQLKIDKISKWILKYICIKDFGPYNLFLVIAKNMQNNSLNRNTSQDLVK